MKGRKPKRFQYDGPIEPGVTIHRLTITERAPSKTNRGRWVVTCSCGTTLTAVEYQLRNGSVRSCGCWARERLIKHGHASNRRHSATYQTWSHMIDRCENPNDKKWSLYGGRGIAICEHWRNSFENFLADMGEKPRGATIDRVDNDRGYEPANCRWATPGTQTRNRSISKLNAVGAILLRQMWLRSGQYGRKKQIAEWFEVGYAQAHKVGNGKQHADALDELMHPGCGRSAP